MLSFLPENVLNQINEQFSINYISEIRLRINQPILITYKSETYQLKEGKLNLSYMIATSEMLNEILEIATKQSFYAYSEQIKNGYITTDYGVRIGLCGTVVYNGEKVVLTIKNITSLNIRIPHQIENCSNPIINFIYVNQTTKNTLIISPPGAGKTTLIRDIAIQLSRQEVRNILVIDEKFEIFGASQSNLNHKYRNIDILSGANKEYALNVGVQTLAPNVIITDEISKQGDIDMLEQTLNCGVNVIATAHAKNIQDLKRKKYLQNLLEKKYFERIIILSKRNGVGTIEGIFDENLKCLFLPYMG